MEEINHFSHEKHPLKLIKGETIVGVGFKSGDSEDKPEVVGCFACEEPILSSGSAYACTECHFYLHKSCAQLPLTINLPSLYQQPLILFNYKTTGARSFTCDVCCLQHLVQGLCYSSDRSDKPEITACISCCAVEIACKTEAAAIKEEAMVKLKHEGHPQHNLTLQLRPGAILCDACKTEEKDLFYLCDSCDFCIHKGCTSLAPTLDLPHHPKHSLVLVYSLPDNFFKFPQYCEFCNKYIRRNEWLYHCANCRYFAHIKCASNAPPSIPRDRPSTSGANEDSNNLLHFPMPYAFTDPLKLLHLDKLSLNDNDEVEIKHWSHRHPLILNVEAQHNNMPSTSDSIEVCYGCLQPLSFPYYSCKDGCSFTLHKYCAQLPLTLKHQLHLDHPLNLVDTFTHYYFYECTGCYSRGNTFVYKCQTCGFHLCVNCSYLPNIIKHKTHNHPLIQVIDPQPLCKACGKWHTCISYACKACEFQLGMFCAMRSPQSLAHRYCKGHEVLLTYPPVENHPEDFYCDICEEEMHPKRPLYHCQKHKNSFHLDCLSCIDYYANVWRAGTRTVSYHKHPLTYVRRKKSPRYVCSTCNQDINGYLVLECRARVCNFIVCYYCHLNKEW